MKLYFSPGACSLTIRIVINELNLPCEFESVNLKTKKTETGENFLDINPKGQVPTLVLENKEVLTENTAIQQYLAEKKHADSLLPSVGDFNRYHVLEWMAFVSTELHKSFGPFFNPQVPQALKQDLFEPLLKKKFQYVENNLKQEYLVGHQFTLPDAYLFVMLSWLPVIKLDLSEWPRLSAYFERLKQRESIQKALKEEGLVS